MVPLSALFLRFPVFIRLFSHCYVVQVFQLAFPVDPRAGGAHHKLGPAEGDTSCEAGSGPPPRSRYRGKVSTSISHVIGEGMGAGVGQNCYKGLVPFSDMTPWFYRQSDLFTFHFLFPYQENLGFQRKMYILIRKVVNLNEIWHLTYLC